ncbi:hypothetical protein C0993_004112 [Termitomyces sp. T159_Od127]|nr:hypothetical protein C0993_004112 [Termitomyces sp. T159_Od127]
MQSINSCHSTSPDWRTKSKRPWHSKRGTSTHEFNPRIPEYSIPGSSAEEITEVVCNSAPFSSSAPYLPIAALAIYQRARRIQDLVTDPEAFAALSEGQLEAYNLAINALSLVDARSAWILLPLPTDQPYESRKRRRLTKYVPEDKFTPGRFDSDIIRLTDIQYDHALLSAQIDIIRREPAILSFPEDTSDWLLNDDLASWSGTPVERGWRYLRQALQQHDSAETDYRYSKATLETILGADRKSSPPPWLINILEENHHEYLIRISLRYDNLEAAIEHTLSLIRKSDSRLAREAPENACSTWLPYTLIDQVLTAANQAATSTPKLSTLRSVISSRIKRMQKLSQPAR